MLTVEGQIWPKNGPKLIQMVKNISSTSKRQTRPPFHTVLAIWSNIWPIFVQTWPNLTVFGPNFDILCKIHTQGLKLHEKMALFGPLGLLIRFWPFGPILDLLGPISPRKPGKPQLFSGLPDFTYLQVFEIALTLAGGNFLIFGLGQSSQGRPVSNEFSSVFHTEFLTKQTYCDCN